MAVQGRLAHKNSDEIRKEIKDSRRRTDITMIVQKLQIEILILRSAIRKEKETDEDEELLVMTRNPQPTKEGGEMFPPTELKEGTDTAFQKLVARYPNAIWANADCEVRHNP